SHEPLYVVRVDPARREVIVGPRAALACGEIGLREVNWLGEAPDAEGAVAVKIRSMSKPAPARIHLSGDEATVVFDAPQFGVAPGRAGVIYRDSGGLGGGWIRRAPAAVQASAA